MPMYESCGPHCGIRANAEDTIIREGHCGCGNPCHADGVVPYAHVAVRHPETGVPDSSQQHISHLGFDSPPGVPMSSDAYAELQRARIAAEIAADAPVDISPGAFITEVRDPAVNGREICARCRHPRPLHGKNKKPGRCRARGCHAGPDEGSCPGFVSADDQEQLRTEILGRLVAGKPVP